MLDVSTPGLAAAIHATGKRKEEMKASREAWWIARLALNQQEQERPAIGDWAVECSHLIGMPKKESIGLACAIGKVISIEPNDCWVLELADGTQQRWENALMRKLPKPASE